MSENQKMISGTKRRSLQEQREDEHESYRDGEPAAKTRRIEHGFVLDNNNNSNNNSSSNNNNNNADNSAWPEEQHRDFVAAIFEIGLKHASPAVILENMNQKVETITSERVKSKLQKYRSSKNKEKSKNEFMDQYSDFLQKIQSIQEINNMTAMADTAGADPVLLRFLEESACKSSTDPCSLFLSGGDVAGYLTHCVWKEAKQRNESNASLATKALMDEASSVTSTSVLPTNVLRKGARDYVDNYAGCPMHFPVLTETEKKTSLGIAMTFVVGLFLTMSQHLTRERARAETIGVGLLRSTNDNDDNDNNNNNTDRAIPDNHSTTDNTMDYNNNNNKGGTNI